MKTVIYSLYQRHELQKLRCFIAQVLPALSHTRQLYILINDEDCPDLRTHTDAASPHIVVHCAGGNLGVAGGRNFLIRRALEAGAEFLISCDTDIIYENGYFDRLSDAYRRIAKTDPLVSFIQPILLDGRKVRRFFSALHKAGNWDDVRAGLGENAPAWRDSLWNTVKEKAGPEKALLSIYHSGVSNIWSAHFGAPPDERMPRPWLRPQWGKVFGTRHATVRSDFPLMEKIIANGIPVRIASTAGGISAFHKSVFEAVGDYDEIFNPFGYEDSEMGFRSNLTGRHNYLIPNIFAIHDVFMGETNRSLMSFARLGLLRGVELTHPKLTGEDFDFAFQQSALFCWRELVKFFADEINSSRLSVADAERRFPDFALSYAFDLLRGILHGLNRHPNRAERPPVIGLLRGLLDGDAEIGDFHLPLGLGARFVAGRASSRRRASANGGAIHSLFASNCRIEETTEAGLLSSRYFDLACVIRPAASERRYRVTVDIQSDDLTFATELIAERPASGAHNEGSIRVEHWASKGKRYDFGQFSLEDIYPVPTLYRSQSWLPMMQTYLDRIAATGKLPKLADALRSMTHYMRLAPLTHAAAPTPAVPLVPTKPASPAPRVQESSTTKSGRKRILVFADSRGQHKPLGAEYPIFGERLAADPRLEVDLFLCPMKWTTTLDFLERFDQQTLAGYEHVILYTGIVDWSPRKLSNAVGEVYNNPLTVNAENLRLNTREYAKKIVNNKKEVYDSIFGIAEMASHFDAPFDTVYEGEKTTNMYSLEMARRSLLPRLLTIPNLIYITANRFVSGWNGDYRRQRPANISLTHAYSDLFAEILPHDRVIDLRQWTDDDVQIFTCDNLHLAQRGSDFIYEKIMKIMDMRILQNTEKQQFLPGDQQSNKVPSNLNILATRFTGLRTPERITVIKKLPILSQAKRSNFLATLVVGVRIRQDGDVRNHNLKCLLDWIDFFYGDLFDVLLVEQDSAPRLNLDMLGAKSYVRKEFIFNPHEYNRGWGYNVAVRQFCDGTDVVALMDTDVLTGANFVREIIDCHTKYDAISPYQNIYYTDALEATQIRQNRRLEKLNNEKKIKNPVTVSGGILIIRRDIFLALKGFEQYIGYGCEDRSLDVTLYNHLDHKRIRIASETYPHLHHPSDSAGRVRFEEIFKHLVSHYGCTYHPELGPYDFIHSRCSHVTKEATLQLMIGRSESFGDPDLYRHSEGPTVNGIVGRPPAAITEVIFPPDFQSLDTYARKELYESAPEPDSAELAQFYNAFRGKRCFIIGNGPSLNKHDLKLLNNEYSFGVNSFYYKTRETGFRPFFYVVEDSSVMKENIDEIRRFDAPFKFFPTNYRNLHPKQPNTIFFRMNRGFYEKSSPNYVVPRFSTDASAVLYCGQSVTYINLQLAYFMGFSEVYLIGMDFSYAIPDTHKRTGDVLLSDTDDPNHFHKDYFGKGKTWKDPKLDRVALNYHMAKLVFESTGRRIYNATAGGHLEIFDRVDYECLFRKKLTAPAIAPTVNPVNAATSFATANALYRAGQFSEALSAYVALADGAGNGPKSLYQRSALDAFRRVSQSGQVCDPRDVAFVRGLARP